MKTILAIAAALSLSTGVAFAGEGNGNPFSYQAPGISTSTTGMKALPPGLDDPFPFRAKAQPLNSASVIQPTGSESDVESLNSLPAGFEDNAAQLAQVGTPASRVAAAPANTGLHG